MIYEGNWTAPIRDHAVQIYRHYRLRFSAMRGGHFQANKYGGGGGGGGGYIIKCGIFLHLNTSRLLIITIWNRILISTCIAGIVD